jgi:hypothetical protein
MALDAGFDGNLVGVSWHSFQIASMNSMSSMRPRIVDANAAKSSKQFFTA